MGKQTMATPTHTWHLNSETKIYRLQTPTSPFFRPLHYDKINLDDYAMGTNAIVAVISYTGNYSKQTGQDKAPPDLRPHQEIQTRTYWQRPMESRRPRRKPGH